jgi:hypothetical protein
MLNMGSTVHECDARMLNRITEAGNKKNISIGKLLNGSIEELRNFQIEQLLLHVHHFFCKLNCARNIGHCERD